MQKATQVTCTCVVVLLPFFPKAKPDCSTAGLLARPSSCAFPGFRMIEVIQKVYPSDIMQERCFELTAAGTAPDLHRIPF